MTDNPLSITTEKTLASTPCRLRPLLHFTTPAEWLNDPNGLVYVDGEYQLCFQYNPHAAVWGDIHWGRATSTDLIHWTHHQPILAPDVSGLGMVFSGGAVVDSHNSSGLQQGDGPLLVATFTHHDQHAVQRQSVALSHDQGATWTQYAHNPVIDNPGLKDFRDPSVTWDALRQQWVMSLAVGDRIQFYVSSNLLSWSLTGEFVSPYIDGVSGVQQGVWECPSLLFLSTHNKSTEHELTEHSATCGESRWVLLVSIGDHGPLGGSAMQYFVGEFDGNTFIADALDRPSVISEPSAISEPPAAKWVDFGPDFYAGLCWEDALNKQTSGPQTQRTLIAWMSNWRYALRQPTAPWRGNMTLPRTLFLFRVDDGFYLGNRPVSSVDAQFSPRLSPEILTNPNRQRRAYDIGKSGVVCLDWCLDVAQQGGHKPTLRLGNALGEYITIEWHAKQQCIVIDRRHCGWSDPEFARVLSVPLIEPLQVATTLSFRVIYDQCCLEVFINDGWQSITLLVFPQLAFDHVLLEGDAALAIAMIDELSATS